MTSKWAERARSSPYYPALSHPVFRKVLPGTAASALGDGMSAVAIAWLAVELAPPGSRGLWVGAAVAAYSLPGAIGAVALRRWLVGRHGAGLVIVNSVLRAAALGLVGGLALAGLLDLPVYVALLGVSSLLAAWGVAGKYTLIADLLPAGQRVAGNSVFGLADQVSLMIGPALAGAVTALAGTIWAIFGVGAVIGELSAPFLRRWPVWPVMTAIVLGWGLALVPFGLPTPLWIGLAAFTAGAVIWGPWMSLSMGVFQDASPPGALAQVLAARSSLLMAIGSLESCEIEASSSLTCSITSVN